MPDLAVARVWLTIGVLDARAVSTLREVCPAWPPSLESG